MNVVNRFIKAAELFPENIALEVRNQKYSYRQLAELSAKVASQILNSSAADFVGILAYRSLSTYVGILGALIAGKSYVPLNPKFPLKRIVKIIELTGCDTFIVDDSFFDKIKFVSSSMDRKLTFIFVEDPESDPEIADKNVYIDRSGIESSVAALPVSVTPATNAYLLFTSGTTGEPKGIPITHKNLTAYLDFVQGKYPLVSNDRCSQAFDTTFDPSVHDIWMTWSAGATLVVVPEAQLLNSARFIQKYELSVWYSVPTVGLFMKRLRLLKPGIFPRLRYSIFSGEALPADFAAAWQQAAPNSVLINFYGPTEATINISDYVWETPLSARISENNIVPIGNIFPTHKYLILDEQQKPVPKGECGELVLSGDQVCNGYFKVPQKTNDNFVAFAGKSECWFRTGDMVKELFDSCLLFLGRKDSQVKVKGYRVELQAIEGLVKKIFPESEVKVLAYPVIDNIAEGITCFIAGGKTRTDADVIKKLSETLPFYMVPDKFVYLREFPLNDNGKLDQKELMKSYGHG